MELYPHQAAAVESVELAMANGCQRQVVQMATGAGKTIFAGALMEELLLPNERVLFLAHREDLLTQARDAFAHFFPASDLGIVQGPHDEFNKRIVFGMFQTLVQPNRLARTLVPGPFPYVIVDECHHALAPSYRTVISTAAKGFLLGITATPSRADRQSLRKVFEKLTYSIGMLDLICSDPPYLVDLRGVSIRTDLDLSRVSEDRYGDLVESEVRQAVHASKQRHTLAINAIVKYAHDWQGLYFAVDVRDARMFALAANAAGIPTEVIVGTTTEEDRTAIKARYLKGETQYIANVAVLTEGTDLPPARVAVMGRPTRSQELYTQCVGRVCRVLPEDRGLPVAQWQKPYALVIDLTDTQHTILTLPDLIGSTDEVMRKKSVRQTVEEEEQTQREEREETTEPLTRSVSLQVASKSLFSQKPWRRDGQDFILKTPYGTARVEAEFNGHYWVMFESAKGHTTRIHPKAIKLEHALAMGEQKVAQLEAADTKREQQRSNPAERSRPASPGMEKAVKAIFPFLRNRRLSAGEARDWLDRHQRARDAGFKSWWDSPDGQQWKAQRATKAQSAAKRAAKGPPRKPHKSATNRLRNDHQTTFIEE